MTTKICPACKGVKTVMGIGMMYHDCRECDAIGYVKVDDDTPPKETTVIKHIKRRGRQKKEIEPLFDESIDLES